MKIRNILSLLAAALLAVSCMDGDWDAPKFSEDNLPFGNSEIQATNPVTIADLKKMYPGYSKDDTTYMDKEAQLKVYVTGNDIQGNLYNSIAVQDENGDAIIVCVYENSMFSYLPVGQELLVETKGLYIGSYGGQPQIGTPYTNKSGKTFPSRMNSNVWQKHFRLLPTTKAIQTITEHEDNPIGGAYVIPEYSLAELEGLNKSANAGKLMTIVNVEVDGADGTKTWASKADAGDYTNVQLYFKGAKNRNTLIYTSTYADFANEVIPTGKLNLTGVWKVYNSKWELILRSDRDIETAE